MLEEWTQRCGGLRGKEESVELPVGRKGVVGKIEIEVRVEVMMTLMPSYSRVVDPKAAATTSRTMEDVTGHGHVVPSARAFDLVRGCL